MVGVLVWCEWGWCWALVVQVVEVEEGKALLTLYSCCRNGIARQKTPGGTTRRP